MLSDDGEGMGMLGGRGGLGWGGGAAAAGQASVACAYPEHLHGRRAAAGAVEVGGGGCPLLYKMH